MSKTNWKLAFVLSYLMYLSYVPSCFAKGTVPTKQANSTKQATPAKQTIPAKQTNPVAKSTLPKVAPGKEVCDSPAGAKGSTGVKTSTGAKTSTGTKTSTGAKTNPSTKPSTSAKANATSTGAAASTATAATTAPTTTAKAEDKEEELKPVLPPEQFFGMAAMGYASAKACPHVCSKVFCYCGCDITDNHNNLLDCFTGMHGVDCHICQEEAMQALSMHREGKSISDIQKAIDLSYAGKYPFETESPALKKYKSLRLWSQGLNKVTAGEKTGPKEDTCCSGNETPKK